MELNTYDSSIKNFVYILNRNSTASFKLFIRICGKRNVTLGGHLESL